MFRAAGPTDCLQEPSSIAGCEPHTRTANTREMLGGLGRARMEAHGLQDPPGPFQMDKHGTPRSELSPTLKPPAHSNLLLVWLGVPPAANGAVLQSLRGDSSSAEQQSSCSYIGFPCPLTAAKLLIQKATLFPKLQASHELQAQQQMLIKYFFLCLSCSFSLEPASPPRDHILNLLVH